ncbi:hypothetical protein N7466_008517 [Penicillium verhagenii]|uniref:uncharacterized protein n=1 Tax=Penicillium verhagenii TaxID=1562060 RepID=UPI0025452140|nr:uncharacterized protein N7466_008517 [Penicillium verhagenii]KAJ5924330.1 hypothetical protein N7466_008517 [Penicillium verhagenii]
MANNLNARMTVTQTTTVIINTMITITTTSSVPAAPTPSNDPSAKHPSSTAYDLLQAFGTGCWESPFAWAFRLSRASLITCRTGSTRKMSRPTPIFLLWLRRRRQP